MFNLKIQIESNTKMNIPSAATSWNVQRNVYVAVVWAVMFLKSSTVSQFYFQGELY